MNEPTTSIGKEMAADDRQHGSACEVRQADWCRCGQVENIVMVERQERERLWEVVKPVLGWLLPGYGKDPRFAAMWDAFHPEDDR